MKRFKALLDRLPIMFTAQAWLYPILLIASLIFAQTLKMAVSYTVFLFVLLLPLGTLVHLLLAKICIKTAFRVSDTTVEKRRLISLCAGISNKSPMPFPFAEAQLLLPDERGIRCEPVRFIFSLMPFSDCRIERSAEFSFRGEYDIGLSHIYIYDLTRSVRLRINARRTERIFVLPRRIELPPREGICDGESDTERTSNAIGRDNTELSDVRLYEAGDNLKRIHWKLSSKSEEIIVKDYEKDSGTNVCVLCDLEPYYGSMGDSGSLRIPTRESADVIDFIGADTVIEAALAVTLREIRDDNTVTLAWIENGRAVSAVLDSISDFEAVFRRFASAPLDRTHGHIGRIVETLEKIHAASPIIVCPNITPSAVGEYTALLSAGSRSVPPELLLCTDSTLFVPDPAADRQLDGCVRELMNAGIRVEHIRPKH